MVDVETSPDEAPVQHKSDISQGVERGAVRKCVVVASHPRSGTHLTIDFIRRNFPSFDTRLRIWQSARGLYWNLDEGRSTRARFPSTNAGYVIAKTHKGRVCFDVDRMIEQCGALNIVYVYPFRQFSRTIKGFAELMGFRGSISEFIDSKDSFFGLSKTVADCVTLHAEEWLANSSHKTIFLNVDNLIRDPNRAVSVLEATLDEPATPLERRLPRPKRWRGGKISELCERLTGRESTALVVYRHPISWGNEIEQRQIDDRFKKIFTALERQQIN